MSIFDAYHAGRGMVFLLFQSFHSHVWRPAVIPLAFDRRRYHEPPLLPLMVNVLGPEVLEQKVLGQGADLRGPRGPRGPRVINPDQP